MENATYSPVLSVNEAAAYLRVSRVHVYNLLRAGKLPVVKVGGRTLIRRSDADALISRSTGNYQMRRRERSLPAASGVFA